jgi:hypothetical protein
LSLAAFASLLLLRPRPVTAAASAAGRYRGSSLFDMLR